MVVLHQGRRPVRQTMRYRHGRCVATATIAAPLARTWALVADFAAPWRWNPLLVGCRVARVDGRIVRTAAFPDWWIRERLERHDRVRHRLLYRVVASSRPGIAGATGMIAARRAGPARTYVVWTASAAAVAPVSPRRADALQTYYHRRLEHLRAMLCDGTPAWSGEPA